MKKYRYITILLCMLSTFYVNAEVLTLSQRTISETNEPGFELDYIKNFKKNLSQRELAWLAQRESIVVGVVKPFTPPFEVITSDNKLEGISADILSVLAKLTGKNVSIKIFESQQQALSAIENRSIDILNISSLLPDASTKTVGLFSSNVMLDNCAYLASIKSISANINEPKIAYESGGMDVDSLASAYPKAMLIPFENITDAYDAVVFGKADAVVGSISSLTYLNKSRLNGLPVKERTKISCAPLQFFIAGHNPPLKKIINRLITEMQKSSLMGLTALRWRGGSYKVSDKLLKRLSPVADAWLTSEPVVRVGLIPNDFPYSFIDPTRQWQGIIIDVLNNVRYASGLSFDFISYDSSEALDKAMSSSHIDMIGNTLSDIHSAETLHSIYYNKDDFLVLLSTAGKIKKTNRVVISKKHLDILNSWSGIQYEDIIVLNNDRAVMQYFEDGNSDFAIVSQYLADYYTSLSKRPYKVIERVGPPILQRAFAMKENDKPLLEVMNSAMASISPSTLSDIAYFWRVTPLPKIGFYAQYADNIKILAGIVLPLLLAYILYSYRIHHELSTRKKLEKVLLGQLDLMQSLLDGLPHPVTLINADGTVIYSNKAFLTAVGYAKECTKGANLFTFFSDDDFLNVVGKVVRDMEIVVRDNKVNITGSLIDIQEWFIPYHNIYDDSTGVLWGWFDVTWRNEICRQLELSKHEAVLANQAKSEFIATISHEIRTPINIINGFLTLVLERTSLCDIDREELEYTKSAADGLLCLVGDVLDVTKIEAGLLSLELSPINIGDLVRDVVSMFSTMTKEKSLTLILKSELDNCLIQLDPLRTKQILFNLIGNAVKFTHEGTIMVSAWKAGNRINISVQDSGIGIDSDKLADLFKPFVQVHGESSYQGSGLGLNITKRLCELMGGDVAISSEIGKGTEVNIVLPYQPVDMAALPVMHHVPEKSGSIILPASVHLLIIDDHPVNLILLRRRLTSLGFENIHEADNGWQALEIVKSEKIHIIITDCQMLGMDGFTLVKALRQYEIDSGCTRHIILGLTASGLAQDRDRGIAVGMDACMFKPIDSEVLYREIMDHLHRVDIIDVKIDNADGNDLLRNPSFINMVIDSTTADLASARKAYSEHDMQMLVLVVHRIKGVFLTIKHDEIVSCCKEIEMHLMNETHTQQIISSLDRIQELMKYIKNER